MRHPRSSTEGAPYQIEYVSGTLSVLRALPPELGERILAGLRGLADLVGVVGDSFSGHNDITDEHGLHLRTDNLVIGYRLDARRRVLTVERVQFVRANER